MSGAESEPAARPAAVRRTYGRPREPLEDLPIEQPVDPVPAYNDFALGIEAHISRPSYAKSFASKARVVDSDSDVASDKEDDGKHVSLPGGMYDWKSRLAALDASGSEDDAKAVRKKAPTSKRATSGSPTPSMRNATRPAPKGLLARQTIADQDSSPLSSHREGVSFDFSTELNKSGDQSPDTSPSTSPVELLPAIEEPAPKSKSKSKAKGSELDEPKSDAAKSRGKKAKGAAATDKPTKPKRLTKKEKADMERETARIISNQRVSLSRADVDKRLPLSQWTQKMSTTFQSRSQSSTPAAQVPKPAPSSPIDRFSSSSAVDDLRAAAKPAFTRDPKQPVVNTKDMNKVLLARSKAQGVKIREEKKQDWIRRGGSLRVPEEQRAPVEAPKTDADADEDARDLDYAPDDESGDESGREDSPGVGSGDEVVDSADHEQPPVSSLAAQSDYEMHGDTEEEEEQARAPKRKALGGRRKAALVLDESDSEHDNVRVQVLVPASSLLGFPGGPVPQRRPMSPVGSASESEKDKENSEFRAFDVSEDKENRAAPRYVNEIQSSMSPFPQLSPGLAFSDEEDKENELQPVLSQPPFAARLQRRATYDSSQPRSVLSDIATEERPALATLSLESPVRRGDDSPTTQRRSPGLGDGGPGLTQLFEQGEPSQRPAPLSRSVSEQIPRRLFGGTQESLQFTPTQHRRSGVQISDSQRERDDQILALDMEEEPTQVASAVPKEEWFVKDNGLLTQTRPEFTPIPPLQAAFGALQDSPFTPTFDSASRPKLGRLLKRKSSPGKTLESDDDERTGDTFFDNSPPPAKRPKKNAFDVLKHSAALSDKQKAKEEKRKMQNEYVQDQADESDDETGLGFGGVSGSQDEVIDEAAIAKEIADMVDDAQMDVDELAPDLVAEKHQEHLKEDDEALEQLHQKAIQGQLRKKRRGDGLTMSDDDSDDEGRIKRPRPVKHARNIENDSLPELAKHPETKAFFDTYQKATVDDDKLECPEMDFANADDDDELEVEGAEEEAVEEEEKAPRRRFVDPRQLRDELLAQYQQPAVTINPNDVDWVENDDDDDEMDLEVQEVPVKGVREAAAERVDRDLVPKRPSTATSAKLQTWAKLEGANKGFNARRGGAGTAVTGHASSSRVARTSAPTDQRKAAPAVKPRKNALGKFLEKTKSRQD
ncbi:hypothetical protein AURDEDRAFT_148715, partial [Auricularia subglabra TFB-10046 SS5]